MTNDENINVSDYGTKERHGHDGGLNIEIAEKTKAGRVLLKRAKSAYPSSLHWYYKKGTITPEMLEAGTIFSYLFNNAMLVGSPQSCLRNPIKVDGSSGTGLMGAEYGEDARRKIHKCYELMTGLEQDVIRNVAGFDERASGDKRVLALKTGLRALCVYFRIPVT